MDIAIQAPTPPRWAALLAGLQAGTVGTFAALAWMGLSSTWQRRSFWAAVNLMASTFYGEESIHAGFASSSATGIALYLVMFGVLGAVFAAACAGRVRGLPLLATGILFGLAWYYFSFAVMWKRVNPLMVLLHAQRPTLVGHLLFGAVLGRYERFVPSPPESAQADGSELSDTPSS